MPRIRPDAEPKRMRVLQSTLLALAEGFFGTRDRSFSIADPRFHERGPFLQHSSEDEHLWVELSNNAAGYWPTAVFELAHESVHLLNPVKGYTNTLEEGFAVAFHAFRSTCTLWGGNLDNTRFVSRGGAAGERTR